MVFTEFHRAAHSLWHTVDPAHPDHRAAAGEAGGGPGLADLLRAIDREIGHLRDLAGPETAILVFSLHGMRPARGVPTILGPWLETHGFAARRPWRARSGSEHVEGALAAVKRLVPDAAKRLYRRSLPSRVVDRLTRPSMPVPVYDWARTTAFSLPTDQHGWIRVNLRGREALGSVEPGQYEAVCQRLEHALRAARRADGQPIVEAVIRSAPDARAAATTPLPDLIVHWTDATFACPLRLDPAGPAATPVGRWHTGQHAPRGFYVLRPGRHRPAPGGGPVTAEHLHRLIRDAAGGAA
jgi:predicted AlkP superfamily phosphohydrolase/phosphomutase